MSSVGGVERWCGCIGEPFRMSCWLLIGLGEPT